MRKLTARQLKKAGACDFSIKILDEELGLPLVLKPSHAPKLLRWFELDDIKEIANELLSNETIDAYRDRGLHIQLVFFQQMANLLTQYEADPDHSKKNRMVYSHQEKRNTRQKELDSVKLLIEAYNYSEA